MAIEIKLLKLYNVKSGALKAKIQYGSQTHIIKCGKRTRSLISMPIGFTSFEVTDISNNDLNKSVTIQTLTDKPQTVTFDFIESQFI